MRDQEALLQEFADFMLRASLVQPKAAPYCVRWVRRFLARPATNDALADRVRRFCDDLEREKWQDWQVRQAEHAVRIYFVNFLKRTDWERPQPSSAVDAEGRVDPLGALEQLRMRIRTRHYSFRTERSYTDWVRRLFAYLSDRQERPHPLVEAAGIRDFLTHLAVQRRVSASTQNQALSAMLLLSREVLRLSLDGLSVTARARRGSHLPVVLSVPETASLLGAMHGATRLMASLIYGGGLRVSECCELRVKDLDFDQGLVVVRNGQGANDRTTLLPESVREELRGQLQKAEALHRADRAAGLAGVWLPDALSRKCRTPAASSAGSGCSPATHCHWTRAPPSCAAIM